MKCRFKPKSRSYQAHVMCDELVEKINLGYLCLEQAHRFFVFSSIVNYRKPLVIERAAKRFHRLCRAEKVHESPQAVLNWYEYKKRYNIEEEEKRLGTCLVW